MNLLGHTLTAPRAMKKQGWAYLAKELARVRARPVVFGHSHGQEEQVFDRFGKAYEAFIRGRGGWGGCSNLATMALAVLKDGKKGGAWGAGRLRPQKWRIAQKRTDIRQCGYSEKVGCLYGKNEPIVFTI